jgi:hypothetical protein
MLEGSQSAPVRPSNKGNVEAKTLGWLEARLETGIAGLN